MASITEDERLNLKKLIDEMDSEDNTEQIRRVKHSVRIRDDIRRMEQLKQEHATLRITNMEEFFNIVQCECRFLYDNYMDIFTRCMKDELDISIMTKVLIVLKLVEDGKYDQHEGSVMIGRYLKELYLDSAVKRADNLDKEREGERVPKVEGKKITWKAYKLKGNQGFP
jgi:hypothetical protein